MDRAQTAENLRAISIMLDYGMPAYVCIAALRECDKALTNDDNYGDDGEDLEITFEPE